jgi:hypothetical protein
MLKNAPTNRGWLDDESAFAELTRFFVSRQKIVFRRDFVTRRLTPRSGKATADLGSKFLHAAPLFR